MNNLKRCPRCQLEYPADAVHFYRNGGATLRARCKACERQRKWESYQRMTAQRGMLERIARELKGKVKV